MAKVSTMGMKPALGEARAGADHVGLGNSHFEEAVGQLLWKC